MPGCGGKMNAPCGCRDPELKDDPTDKRNRPEETAAENQSDDPWEYSGARLQALQFPLGGFGTGNVLLQGDGTLQGWTIQNQFHDHEYTPLHKLPGNMFAISARMGDDSAQAFVLQSNENYTVENQNSHFREESHVTPHQVQRLQQFPGIKSLTMKCQYPMAQVKYDMPDEFPVEVKLEAMTPLIPNDSKASSYPVAVFTFTLQNKSSSSTVSVDLMQSTLNFIGWDGDTDCCSQPTPFWGSNVNAPIVNGGSGVFMTSQQPDIHATRQGSVALVATADESSSTTSVILGATTEQELFDRLVRRDFDEVTTPPSQKGTTYMGAAIHSVTLAPQSTTTCRFVLAWYFPNRPNHGVTRKNLPKDIWGNMYQNWFTDASHVVSQFQKKSKQLVGLTHTYVDTLYSTTMPFDLLESAAGRLACLRSPTMFWTRDGIVLGNEGNACCPLNCTHVYGYTTLLERVFPDLAQDMRLSDFVRNFDAQHGCTMRFGQGGFAIDGSLASVIKTYLVVQQSDPTLKFLGTVWPNVKKQMDLVFQNMDVDGDGVLRGMQQNTYDSAMQGANTFIGSYWVTALKAVAAMANLMGELKYAAKCTARAKLAATNYEAICWKDDSGYYTANVDESNCAHSYGPGCFVDQLCAIGLSTACGFGYCFDPDHEAKARRAILKYNVVTKPPFQDLQKHFYNGDTGIQVCSYPHGKLGNGMDYTTLVSTGFTYPVVSGMIYDGNLEGAVTICQNIRARHSGVNRSPWNEPECGLLYSRSMAAWNLYDQACGFSYDSTRAILGYHPKVKPQKSFSCLTILHGGWGKFTMDGDASNSTAKLKVHCGQMVIKTLQLDSSAFSVEATLDDKPLPCSIARGGVVSLGKLVTVSTNSILVVRLSSPCEGSRGRVYLLVGVLIIVWFLVRITYFTQQS